jgi:hypothetical protein
MPDEEGERADYFDSLAHSAAVVGINTSAFLEAAVAGRATYTVLSDEFAGTQEGTLHFQYLRAENGGVLHVAADLDEHLAQLEQALRDPEADAGRTRAFVSSFVRPRGLDVQAAPLVAAAIEELGSLEPSPYDRHASRFLIRPLLTLAAWSVSLGAIAKRLSGGGGGETRVQRLAWLRPGLRNSGGS